MPVRTLLWRAGTRLPLELPLLSRGGGGGRDGGSPAGCQLHTLGMECPAVWGMHSAHSLPLYEQVSRDWVNALIPGLIAMSAVYELIATGCPLKILQAGCGCAQHCQCPCSAAQAHHIWGLLRRAPPAQPPPYRRVALSISDRTPCTAGTERRNGAQYCAGKPEAHRGPPAQHAQEALS